MDVHPPHGPIHTVKDFLLHLLTITIGLLIALGLEGTVEWVHHRHLAKEARADIQQEIRDNQQHVVEYIAELSGELKVLKLERDRVDDLLHGRPVKPVGDLNFHDLILQESAWNVALSSGVVTFMGHDEVKRYEKAYTVQREIRSFMMTHIDDRLAVWLFLQRVDSGEKLSSAELESGKRILERIILLDQSYTASGHYLSENVYPPALAQTK